MTPELIVLVLLIIGLAFMALEAFMPAFGLLGLGGIISFITALVMMNDLEHFYGMAVNKSVLVGLGFIGCAVLVVSYYFVQKVRKARVTSGPEIMAGMPARVIEWTGTSGRVHIDGEVWQATGPENLQTGDIAIIQSRDNLTLILKKDS